MNYRMPGFPVLHCLTEFAQTHVHWVSDAIQPSHPLSPLSPCPQSFPASGSFPMSHLFTSGGQNITASASFIPMNIQGWLPLVLISLISLLFKGLSSLCSIKSINSLVLSLLYGPTVASIHDYWKNHSFDCTDFCLNVRKLVVRNFSRFLGSWFSFLFWRNIMDFFHYNKNS